MGMSIGHMALLFGIVLVIFGAGKLPRVMGDIAKGVKAFKEGMKDGEEGNSNDNVAKRLADKDQAA
jgi:sec-independent protein translocase protein TatA